MRVLASALRTGKEHVVMTIVSRPYGVALGAIVLSALLSIPAPAQQGTPSLNPVGRIKVDGKLVRAPEVQAKSHTSLNPPKTEWFQIDCIYETQPEWTDELSITFYVLMKTADPKEPFVLLKSEETYINIYKGVHRARAYVHPSLLRRYGRAEAHAVEFRFQGRLVAGDASDPGRMRQAIEQLSPKDGYVSLPKDTPFAHLDFEAFEMVKPRQAQ